MFCSISATCAGYGPDLTNRTERPLTNESAANGFALFFSVYGLPACFLNARDFTLVCHFTEAYSANTIFS